MENQSQVGPEYASLVKLLSLSKKCVTVEKVRQQMRSAAAVMRELDWSSKVVKSAYVARFFVRDLIRALSYCS